MQFEAVAFMIKTQTKIGSDASQTSYLFVTRHSASTANPKSVELVFLECAIVKHAYVVFI